MVLLCSVICHATTRNSLKSGVTGALRETIRCVAYRETSKTLAGHFVEES